MAAQLMKVGENKVRFNPERLEDVSEALTREDVRALIKSGAVSHIPKKGNSSARIKERLEKKATGKRRGHGSRKGSAKTRIGSKSRWISKIRAIRDEIKKMREDGAIDSSQYRQIYRQAKGNLFHSRRHVREHVERLK